MYTKRLFLLSALLLMLFALVAVQPAKADPICDAFCGQHFAGDVQCYGWCETWQIPWDHRCDCTGAGGDLRCAIWSGIQAC